MCQIFFSNFHFFVVQSVPLVTVGRNRILIMEITSSEICVLVARHSCHCGLQLKFSWRQALASPSLREIFPWWQLHITHPSSQFFSWCGLDIWIIGVNGCILLWDHDKKLSVNKPSLPKVLAWNEYIKF